MVYLSVTKEVPHQVHGLVQRLLLWRRIGLLLLLQGLGSRHHEACYLVVQTVQRLHSCRETETKSYDAEHLLFPVNVVEICLLPYKLYDRSL